MVITEKGAAVAHIGKSQTAVEELCVDLGFIHKQGDGCSLQTHPSMAPA